MVERTAQATRPWRRALNPVADDRRVRGDTRRSVTPTRAPLPLLPVRPQGTLDAATPEDLDAVSARVWSAKASTLGFRRRGMTLLLDHLATFPGDTWQHRWQAAGLDHAGRPVRDLGGRRVDAGLRVGTGDVTRALAALCSLRVIAPSLPALRSNNFLSYEQVFRGAQDDPKLDAFFAAMATVAVSARYKQHALFDVSAALTTQQIGFTDLTPEAFLYYAHETRVGGLGRTDNTTYVGHTAWRVLHETGHFRPSTPPTLRAATRVPQLSPTELVDRFQITHRDVRELLIRYLTRRSHTIDYVTLHGLTTVLCGTFWTAIERINPDQRDLRLNQDTYQRWREGLALREDGRPRTSPDSVLIPVRALYSDIQAWAHEASDWAVWAAPCPIPIHEMRTREKRQRRVRERMADRTRTLQPLLPVLVEHVDTKLQNLTRLLAAASGASAGDHFAVDSHRYQRLFTQADRAHERACGYANVRVHEQNTNRARNLTLEEDTAFWQWAVIETLRHTGARIEEVLELSQLSVRQYQRPNGEVIALLVIAPSKSDRERVIPMSAELFHVIACIIRRLTADRAIVPLATRYDPYERITTEPQPFLFQRDIGQRREAVSPGAVTNRLRRLCDELGQTHPAFATAHFSPQDFRRLLATELVNSGLPIHIGAALLGHLNIETTRGYVAVFQEDVVRHYQAHLARRRALRPADEYRSATGEEWAEFEQHFDRRKVELGNCGRPYGTPCAHEHACIRCPMLRLDPKMVERLGELEVDLLARRTRAEAEGWLGEIEGIDLTLTFLHDKRRVAARIVQPTHVTLHTSRQPERRTSRPQALGNAPF